MKRRALLIILFMVLPSTIGLNAKVVPVGTLAGTVVDSKGNPVAGASVTIQTSVGLHPNAMLTDGSGRFAFARYKIGEYDLRASAGKAKSEWLHRLMIHSDRTTEVTIRLSPDAK